MFNRVFVEKEVIETKRAQFILNKLNLSLSSNKITLINDIEAIFNRVKKPYLQKRSNLNLFIGNKKGDLVKQAPDAYGVKGDPHYYFIHAYNCIYECEYCYLQGYFNSPDIVIFINHEDIGQEIKKIVNSHNVNQTIWFHAGEYSDSLALNHLTNELDFYFDLFKDLPTAKLEFRTKSINTTSLLKLNPLANIITSFSLMPDELAKIYERKVPPTKLRLEAVKKLTQKGHRVGIHFDPIIYQNDYLEQYRSLIHFIKEEIDISRIEYISLGVIRFTKNVHLQVQNNYPNSNLLNGEFVKSFDNKIRYPKSLRNQILLSITDLCINAGISEDKIYMCME